MNPSPEKDLLGYVLGALDAQEQRDLQKHIDANPQVEDDLLAIKNALNPLEYLDSTGSRPGLARRTCELVANLGHPPIRRLDPTKLDTQQIQDLCQSTNHGAVASVINDLYSKDLYSKDLNSPSPATGTSGADVGRELVVHSAQTSDSLGIGLPASNATTQSATQTKARPKSLFSRAIGELGSRSPFSLVDAAVATGFLAILAGVLFPAISYARQQSRIAHCQNNLQQIGRGLIACSEINNGRFFQIPESGPLAVIGSVAPLLKDKGFVENDSLFSCPGALNHDAAPVRIPSIQSIQNAVAENLVRLQQTMSGHYGHTMGHQSPDGRSLVNLSRSYVIIMADSPSSGHDRISVHHDKKGQNCLFEDGHVQFVFGHCHGEDSIFVNDYNLVAPGCRPEDNVIGPSHLSPYVPIKFQQNWTP